MIAVLGATMYEAGDTIDVDDSRVRPDFRPDQVPVTWRSGESVRRRPPEGRERQGAEAVVDIGDKRVTKRRVPKAYRHPNLDDRLRRDRTVLEARLTSAARRQGVPTPVVRDVDVPEGTLVLQTVGDADLQAALSAERARDVGRHLAAIHEAGFVHGDPTTRNVRVDGERTYLIDFGLGYYTDDAEDFAMDLHVFEQSIEGTADDPDPLRGAFEAAYADRGDDAVLGQLRSIEGRGRYQ